MENVLNSEYTYTYPNKQITVQFEEAVPIFHAP